MIHILSYLTNHGAVLAAFGRWPGFHDAPIHDFQLSDLGEGEVHLLVHAFEITSAVDERGFLILRRHHWVRFAFQGISDVRLDRFIEGNILFHLGFSSDEEFRVTGRFRVDLDSAMGGDVGGSFVAERGQVLEVVPCDSKGNRVEQESRHTT